MTFHYQKKKKMIGILLVSFSHYTNYWIYKNKVYFHLPSYQVAINSVAIKFCKLTQSWDSIRVCVFQKESSNFLYYFYKNTTDVTVSKAYMNNVRFFQDAWTVRYFCVFLYLIYFDIYIFMLIQIYFLKIFFCNQTWSRLEMEIWGAAIGNCCMLHIAINLVANGSIAIVTDCN